MNEEIAEKVKENEEVEEEEEREWKRKENFIYNSIWMNSLVENWLIKLNFFVIDDKNFMRWVSLLQVRHEIYIFDKGMKKEEKIWEEYFVSSLWSDCKA